ncbi:hypothetical protein LP419_09475 [Massilia sp. H-1]|nr:hypothetical protein LP419_09475 [Massilia sp. H-1]
MHGFRFLRDAVHCRFKDGLDALIGMACALLARLSRKDLSTERASSVYVSPALLWNCS